MYVKFLRLHFSSFGIIRVIDLVFFLFIQVKSVASHFLKQNKKVLVVGSRPMSLHSKDKRVASVMDFLSEHCGVFCLQKIGSQKRSFHSL